MIFPTLCGGNGTYAGFCHAERVCEFPGIHCEHPYSVPASMMMNCSQLGLGTNFQPRQNLPDSLGNVSFLKSLELMDCPIEGAIPEALGKLGMLEEINIYNCPLSGALPASFGNLHQLTVLSIDKAELSGQIPPELGRLRKLQYLSLRKNRIEGSVPNSLCGLSRLEHLNLGENFLGGALPRDIGNLSALLFLDLRKNSFTGRLPHSLENLRQLRWLDASNNNLEGELPECLSMPKLTLLDFHRNDLSGQIPASWGRLHNLATLDIATNDIAGHIPEDFGKYVPNLKWLDLHSNGITGQIPSSIQHMKDLVLLDLGNNALSGEIPAALGTLQQLMFLGLDSNRLTGPIPPELGGLRKILVLSLADNMLAGSIPPELGDMHSLLGLFLFKNRLSGRIPTEIANLHRLSFLALHENSLHDRVPQFHLQHCKFQECLGHMVLTLHANHLSCELPKPIHMDDRDKLTAAVVHGNKFSLPAPKWLPWEDDPVHFQKGGYIQKTGMMIGAGTLLWLVFLLLVLRGDACSFVRGEVFACAAEGEPEARAHLELLGFVSSLALLSTCVMLPACYMGSLYTECGDQLAHFSLTYLSRAPVSEGMVMAVMAVHLALVVVFIRSIPNNIEPERWLTVMCKALPWDNEIKSVIGDTAYQCIYCGAPAAIAIVQIVVLPTIAKFFSKRMGMSERTLLTTTHLICVWAAPVCAVIYFGEGCGKRWRLLWSVCKLDLFEADFKLFEKSIQVLTKESTCGLPTFERLIQQHNGGCSRDILEVITPLLLQTMAMEAVAFPIAYLLTWVLSTRSEDGQELQLRGLGMRTSFTVEDYFVQLDIWAATAVFWGALVPLLQPLLLLAVCTNFVMLRLEARYFGCRAPPLGEARAASRGKRLMEHDGYAETDELQISKTMLRVAAASLLVYVLAFALESSEAGEV